MEIATEDKTSLQIRRVYAVPVAAVYAAWTDPEQVKHWMGPSDDFGEAEAGKPHQARAAATAAVRSAILALGAIGLAAAIDYIELIGRATISEKRKSPRMSASAGAIAS